jgi:zinc protease
VGKFRAFRTEFSNGLRLIVVEDPSAPTIAYQTWFDVGSRNETPGRTGLAHLFEHMMFKATRTRPEGEFDRTLEANGVEGLNAFTGRDYTAYIQELPSEKLELIARLEADRMVNLVVDDRAFATEREVVQNERRFRTENSPDGTLYQEIFSLAFTQHPYRWPVIGYEEDLARMTGADAREFYLSHYRPNHATIIVVGDVRHTEVATIIERHYGDLAGGPRRDLRFEADPPQKSPRRKRLGLNIQVPKIMLGYPVPEATHPDTVALEVLRSVLTSGKSSRLHKALVESGIASSIGGLAADDRDPSLFLLAANLQRGKTAEQAETAILRELDRLVREPVPPRELERAKNALSFDFYRDLSSNYDKAEFIGRGEVLFGGFENALRIFEGQQRVTPAEIRRVAAKYLLPTRRNVLIGAPK